jgi:predicted nucleotidyltransferase
MMNTYKINYEQLRQQPEISEMLSALQRGLEKFGIDFYLVGAVARDVWMSGIHKIAPRRTTSDIDFAVLINDKGTYEELKEYLINIEGFNTYKGNVFVLIWKDKAEVDLLPFGAIEDKDGKVIITGLGLTNISLVGFTEVYEEGLPELDLEGKHQFKFCTLPGIVLLKMIAWDDRPEERRDDIKDISDILHHFFDMNDEEIWNNHNDLFEDETADLIHIAAKVMGREMRKIASRNKKLFSRIEGILNSNTNDIRNSKMAAIMIEYFDNTVEENVQLLEQLKQGFIERKKDE